MKRIISFVLFIAFILSLSSCTKKENTYSIHTDLQAKYLAGDYDMASVYAKGSQELSYPEPIKITWEGTSADYVITLTDQQNNNSIINYTATTNSIDLYNLNIGCSYSITVTDNNTKKEVLRSVFQVEDIAPRNLYIDGLTNCRDLGGWKTAYGTTVAQNKIIRCSKLTDDETAGILISENGIDALMTQIHPAIELDLRRVDNNENGGITTSVLENVNYISFPMKSGGNILLLNKEKLVDLFDILSDESNYPIVMHCSIGTDRTGLVAFLVNGLLGVSEEDLYRDYLFSNFGEIGSMRSASMVKTYIETVTIDENKTISENIRSYLVKQGVQESKIDAVIRIMTSN